MAVDKFLQIYDENGNLVDYDISANDVKFQDGDDLPTKIAGLEEEISEAGTGNYTKPEGGIPATDLDASVNESLDKADTAYQKPASGIPSTDMSQSVQDALADAETAVQPGDSIPASDVTGLAAVATSGSYNDIEDTPTVDQTVIEDSQNAVSGGAVFDELADKQDTINDLQSIRSGAQEGATALQQGDVSVDSNEDGSFDINVGSESYKINLNHTHENMAKLIVCEESDLPSTLDPATIYAITDSGETEIEKLIIRGMEFAGGGVPAGTPAITKPSGTTINFGENSGSGVSKTIEIKANNHITGDLTVALASNSNLSFDTTNLPSGVTYNSGAGTLTIEQLTAMQGVNITIVYGGSGGAEIDGGIIITGGGASPKSMTVIVEAGPVVIGGIKLTGTQWLKTDYCPGPNTEFSLKCKFTENSNTNNSGYDYTHCYFLCCPYDGNYRFSFYNGQAGDNPWRFLAANENNSSSPQILVGSSTIQTDDSYLNLVKGASNFTLEFLAGGVTPTQYTQTLPLKTTTMSQPLEIGHLSSKTSGEGIFGVYNLTIYELKIYEGGRTDDYLVRHYVPRTIDNVPGLYDLKTHGFISSETNTDVDIVQ